MAIASLNPGPRGAVPRRPAALRAQAGLGLAGGALLCSLLALPARAAGPLPDPTRPPAALLPRAPLAAAQPGQPHRMNPDTARAIAAAQAAEQAAAGASAASAPAAGAPPVVQAVQLPTGPSQGQALALVNGRQVRVGDTIDGRTVLAIDAQGLLLRSAGNAPAQRLPLYSGTSKLAAGSISDSRSASYQAPELPAKAVLRRPQDTAGPGRGATDTPVSLAGRTTP